MPKIKVCRPKVNIYVLATVSNIKQTDKKIDCTCTTINLVYDLPITMDKSFVLLNTVVILTVYNKTN